MNTRTQKQAAIKRAATAAQAQTTKLDTLAAQELRALWSGVIADILVVLSGNSSIDGGLRVGVLGRVKNHVESILNNHGQGQLNLLSQHLLSAAQLGASPFADTIPGYKIPQQTVAVIKSFLANDGLQLSDRIWGNIEDAKAVFNKRITTAVTLGQSASEAALNLIAQGLPVPNDLQKKIGGQTVMSVHTDIKKDFFGTQYSNAKRVFTAEINRAHGVAFESAVQTHPDTIGTQFLLSPNHPHTDICDLHARVNRYGLGKGVYPFGKNPWPAHPGTISYTQVVFSDEITKADRAGQTDRISFLKKLNPSEQTRILGKKKSLALRLGFLNENEINTPWWVLKERYQRRGYDLSLFE